MKFFTYLSVGLMAAPLVSCLPIAEAGVEAARDVDTPSIFGYLGYKKA